MTNDGAKMANVGAKVARDGAKMASDTQLSKKSGLVATQHPSWCKKGSKALPMGTNFQPQQKSQNPQEQVT